MQTSKQCVGSQLDIHLLFFDTFDSFYNDLGLNAQALVWADDYTNNGWAVLNRDATGTLSVRNRQADIIEPDFMQRVILQDGENYNLYQLFDPQT